jgi:cobalt/nickel transport system permease protein
MPGDDNHGRRKKSWRFNVHISEGVLSAPVIMSGFVLSAAGVTAGLRKMEYDQLPEVAVLSSVFFMASLVHVPIGPSAVHLILPGVCGLLLGWTAFPAILMGLALQALLFQYGGLTTLGVNTFIMAFPAVLMGLTCGRFVGSETPGVRWTAEFICGSAAVLLSGCLAAAALTLTEKALQWAAFAVVAAHVPVMIVEGLITVFVIEFVRKVRPEMLPLLVKRPE